MIRTRYAPSPTGDPHLGILRTAVFDYLFAKNQGGTFILRLEDTDQSREKEGSDRTIVESLAWLGLMPDEGLMLENDELVEKGEFGPYIQSKRLPIYQENVAKLLESGAAYRCFCSPERLDQVRAEQQQNHLPPRYDQRCRHLPKQESEERAKSEPFVIRHAIPAGQTVLAQDLIRGEISFQSDDLDDYVLMKSDGFPTYQLANVVDDHLMQISHVLRGEEWIPSLPKNWLLYQAFGWQPPVFVHCPVILGPDGKRKLSKREGADPVLSYRERGYLPEALLNFLTFLGWSPGTEEEFFKPAELIERFRLEKIQKSAAVFDPVRLDYVNGWYIRQLPVAEVVEYMLPYWVAAGLVGQEGNRFFPLQNDEYIAGHFIDYLMAVAGSLQERLKHFDETVELSSFFFERPKVEKELLVPKKGEWETTAKILAGAVTILEDLSLEQWTLEVLQETLSSYIEREGLKNGDLLWPIRAALTGRSASPGAYEMLVILGKDESLLRLGAALE